MWSLYDGWACYPGWHSRRRGYCILTCLSVCLSVCALTAKRLELSTPNLAHVYSIAVAQHALTQRSKGQDHTVTKTVTVAQLLVTMSVHLYTGRCATCGRCRCGSACRYDWLFSSCYYADRLSSTWLNHWRQCFCAFSRSLAQCSWPQSGKVNYSMVLVNHTSSHSTQNSRWLTCCLIPTFIISNSSIQSQSMNVSLHRACQKVVPLFIHLFQLSLLSLRHVTTSVKALCFHSVCPPRLFVLSFVRRCFWTDLVTTMSCEWLE